MTQSGHQTAALPLFATGLGALGLLGWAEEAEGHLSRLIV